jgi:ACS family glucarate transporter-like MFS transporter
MNNKPTNVRWCVLLALVFASFVSYVLRANLSIAAPAMIPDLGVSEVQWGWILAAFTVGYALFQFPGGLLADRFGPRLVLTVIAVLWGVLTILTSMVPGSTSGSVALTIGALILVRFLVGATHAPIFPTVGATVMRWFPVGSWGFPNGLTSTGLTLGYAACAPLLAWLVTDIGWRQSFLVLAPFGFLAAALWWWYARNEPAQHHAVNQAEIDLILAGREDEGDLEKEATKGEWLRVLQNRDVLLVALSYGCMNFVFYDAFNWFFYYLVTVREFGAQDAGLVTSSQWIAGAVGAALGGWLCDRFCHGVGLRWGCRIPILAGLLVSGALLIGGSITLNVQAAVIMLVLCFFFNQLTEGAYWSTATAVGGRYAGASCGVLNTGGNAMGIVNALAVPIIAGALGWTFAMAMGGVVAFIGAGLMLFVRADRVYDE